MFIFTNLVLRVSKPKFYLSIKLRHRMEVANQISFHLCVMTIKDSIINNIIIILANKLDDIRARISFQRDIRDCNIFCLTETWLTPLVPDQVICPINSFTDFRADRERKNPRNQRVEEFSS